MGEGRGDTDIDTDTDILARILADSRESLALGYPVVLLA